MNLKYLEDKINELKEISKSYNLNATYRVKYYDYSPIFKFLKIKEIRFK